LSDFETTVKGLRAWTKDHDPHVKAAVELLIWHDHWIRRADFAAEVVQWDDVGTAWIPWDRARAFKRNRAASSSQLAVLDLAVALGTDQYRLSRMDDAEAGAIVRAFATALGQEGMLRGPLRAVPRG
jgi:hypothetical protein